jgi:hypothetical protein
MDYPDYWKTTLALKVRGLKSWGRLEVDLRFIAFKVSFLLRIEYGVNSGRNPNHKYWIPGQARNDK